MCREKNNGKTFLGAFSLTAIPAKGYQNIPGFDTTHYCLLPFIKFGKGNFAVYKTITARYFNKKPNSERTESSILKEPGCKGLFRNIGFNIKQTYPN